jgi:ABC-type nitrate/sulfonate/bicarbonate transport system permease component
MTEADLAQRSPAAALAGQPAGAPDLAGDGWRAPGWRRLPWRRSLTIVPPILLLALGVLVWQLYVVHYHVSSDVLPSPGRIARQGWDFRQQLWDNTLTTLKETAIGFGVSLAVAFLLATAIDFSTIARRTLYPLMVASQTIPIIAIAPLVVIWWGFGLMPKIILVALATFFPVAVALAEGFNSTEREATNLLRSMGAGRVRIFTTVRFPSAMPYFFAGLRISITYGIVGAIFAEYAGAVSGLGLYMEQQNNSHRTDLVLAAVAVAAILSIAMFALTFAVQRLTIPWYYRARRQQQS